jgi:hypothetical protein
MGLVAKDGGGKKIPPVPAAVYNAVCYMVMDLGTHFDKKFSKHSHSVLIGWELPTERIIIEKDGVKHDLPRAISKKYTLSLHEKAALRKDLQTWRGKMFTEEEAKGFDLNNLLGKSCMIQVIHEKNGETTYANVGAIMPIMKGVTPLVAENPLRFYSIDDNRDVIPDGTPQWIIDQIRSSEEWQAFGPTEEVPVGEEEPPPGDDDVPF